jgi:hypothetical protein
MCAVNVETRHRADLVNVACLAIEHVKLDAALRGDKILSSQHGDFTCCRVLQTFTPLYFLRELEFEDEVRLETQVTLAGDIRAQEPRLRAQDLKAGPEARLLMLQEASGH